MTGALCPRNIGSMPLTPLTYSDLIGHLRNLGVETEAAETHGMLIGLIAAGQSDADALIHEICPFNEGSTAADEGDRRVLLDLASETIRQFDDPTYIFSPILPDDDVTLKERASALRVWCEGFLYGLGVGGTNHHPLSADVKESVDDLAEFTRLNVAIIGETEEEEQALADLLEYVRTAVMTIQGELGASTD